MKAIAVVIGAGLMMVSAIVIALCVFAEVIYIYPFITLVIGFVLVWWSTKDPDEFYPNECDKGQMY